MVVEDERHIRELVVDTLFDCGYDVLEAKNGREAYDLACKENPDLILLDAMMPEHERLSSLGEAQGEHANQSYTRRNVNGGRGVGRRKNQTPRRDRPFAPEISLKFPEVLNPPD
jgi:CheY-like chemotaxis protein